MTPDEFAAQLRDVRFTPVRIREGYDMGEVDQFLDELEAAARRGSGLAALVSTASFTRVKFREGYEIGEVDQFLQRMATVTVTSPPEPASAPSAVRGSSSSAWGIRTLVDRIRFAPVRVREGYDMAEVDDFLERVVQAADRGEPVAPLVDRVEFTRVRVREGYEIGEVDHFLNQLKGGVPAVADPGVIQEQRGLLGRLLSRD